MGNRLSNRAGRVGLRRTDASLVDSVSELNKASFIEPSPRDVLGFGGFDDRTGARAQADIVSVVLELSDDLMDIVGCVMNRSLDQFKSAIQTSQSELFFFVSDRDFVDAIGIGLSGSTETNWSTRQGLQFQGDVLEDMGHVGSSSESDEKATSFPDAATVLDHRREPAHEPLVETWNHLRRSVFHFFEVNPSF